MIWIVLSVTGSSSKDYAGARHDAVNQRAPKSVEGKDLAPQVGLEPTTLRLTAEPLVAASYCKHNYLRAQNADYRVNWGDSGGTLETTRRERR